MTALEKLQKKADELNKQIGGLEESLGLIKELLEQKIAEADKLKEQIEKEQKEADIREIIENKKARYLVLYASDWDMGDIDIYLDKSEHIYLVEQKVQCETDYYTLKPEEFEEKKKEIEVEYDVVTEVTRYSMEQVMNELLNKEEITYLFDEDNNLQYYVTHSPEICGTIPASEFFSAKEYENMSVEDLQDATYLAKKIMEAENKRDDLKSVLPTMVFYMEKVTKKPFYCPELTVVYQNFNSRKELLLASIEQDIKDLFPSNNLEECKGLVLFDDAKVNTEEHCVIVPLPEDIRAKIYSLDPCKDACLRISTDLLNADTKEVVSNPSVYLSDKNGGFLECNFYYGKTGEFNLPEDKKKILSGLATMKEMWTNDNKDENIRE